MKVVCVTGGIGSGKSVVCKIFSRLNIPVYDADQQAKELYNSHPGLAEDVRKKISEDAVDKTGKVNLKKLSEIVFADEEKLAVLNSLVHPLVKWDFENWVETHSGFPYVIKEAAILFESGAFKACNEIITVVSPKELRISRLKERDRKSRQEIEQIMAKQTDDEEKISKSDFVITNDEKSMLIPQVLKIHDALVKK